MNPLTESAFAAFLLMGLLLGGLHGCQQLAGYQAAESAWRYAAANQAEWEACERRLGEFRAKYGRKAVPLRPALRHEP
mgnify:FL=1